MQAYRVTNNGEHPRRFGGEWVAPGESRVIEMRPLPDIVVAKWRRAGVRIVATDMPVAAQEATVEMWSEPLPVEDETTEEAPKSRKGKRRKASEDES